MSYLYTSKCPLTECQQWCKGIRGLKIHLLRGHQLSQDQINQRLEELGISSLIKNSEEVEFESDTSIDNEEDVGLLHPAQPSLRGEGSTEESLASGHDPYPIDLPPMLPLLDAVSPSQSTETVDECDPESDTSAFNYNNVSWAQVPHTPFAEFSDDETSQSSDHEDSPESSSVPSDSERSLDYSDPQNTMENSLDMDSDSSEIPSVVPSPMTTNMTYQNYHALLSGEIYIPSEGEDLVQLTNNHLLDWYPFKSRIEFEVANFLFRRNEMSAGAIDDLMEIWNLSLSSEEGGAPFRDHKDMYSLIDAIPYGDVLWSLLKLRYTGKRPQQSPPPSWMEEHQVVWYCNPLSVLQRMITRPDFKDDFDYVPYQDYVQGDHHFRDFMSGDWAWKQAVHYYLFNSYSPLTTAVFFQTLISCNPQTYGAFFVPIILGSDKTMVSIATSNNEYWPVYISIGNIRNAARRAHCSGVAVLTFLATPKAEKEHCDKNDYRKYRHQLFHESLSYILSLLRRAMEVPVPLKCPDGKLCRAIFGLGPYIVDYPKQCLLSSVVQGWCPKCLAPSDDLDGELLLITPHTARHTAQLVHNFELIHVWDTYGIVGDVVPFTKDFPHANIHELISPDILHQVIKGTFKDHIVTWVGCYLEKAHAPAHNAKRVMDLVDRRIAIMPLFSGLRHFPQGCDFKQWTGNDSKALMKVYLLALRELVPPEMIRAIRYFLECCYIICWDSHSRTMLEEYDETLKKFHQYRVIFVETGTRRSAACPPWQHSLVHYSHSICLFGSPNGICSSITELKHIEAVKKPWRRSNQYNALQQMLKTNNYLDKLQAARITFRERGLLGDNTRLYQENQLVNSEEDDSDVEDFNSDLYDSENEDDIYEPIVISVEPYIGLAQTIAACNLDPEDVVDFDESLAMFPELFWEYLSQFQAAERRHEETISINKYNSAIATFHLPSDYTKSKGGMQRERIRAVKSWRRGTGRYDTVFLRSNSDVSPRTILTGVTIARVKLFFSVRIASKIHDCALVH